MSTVEALLITGPAGSGKSTLGQYIAEQLGWTYISEDEYWINNGWGNGLRSPKREKTVQNQFRSVVMSEIHQGHGIVLEFILYKQPPNPLTAYQEMLSESSIKFGTLVLKPSVDEIMSRVVRRGRPNDIDNLENRRAEAENQLSVLDSEHINPDWVIDPTDVAVEVLASKCIARVKRDD